MIQYIKSETNNKAGFTVDFLKSKKRQKIFKCMWSFLYLYI